MCNRNLQAIWSEERSSSGLLEGNLQEWCTHVTSEKKNVVMQREKKKGKGRKKKKKTRKGGRKTKT